MSNKKLGWSLFAACFGAGIIYAYYKDEITRPKQNENSLLVSCEASAPTPLITEATIEKRYPPVFGSGIKKSSDGYAIDFKGCNITKAFIVCEGAAKTDEQPKITKSSEGYILTRPSKFCDLEYNLTANGLTYSFD